MNRFALEPSTTVERNELDQERERADNIEREKLELYQRRYEEYVRTAKSLQALQP